MTYNFKQLLADIVNTDDETLNMLYALSCRDLLEDIALLKRTFKQISRNAVCCNAPDLHGLSLLHADLVKFLTLIHMNNLTSAHGRSDNP